MFTLEIILKKTEMPIEPERTALQWWFIHFTIIVVLNIYCYSKPRLNRPLWNHAMVGSLKMLFTQRSTKRASDNENYCPKHCLGSLQWN